MFKAPMIALAAFVAAMAGHAQAQDAVHIRVVDVGNGLCVVAVTPDGHSMLYDAGDKGAYCQAAVQDLVPAGRPIDLVVLSHSDADHIGELPAILAQRQALQIVFPGDDHISMTQTSQRERSAIAQEGAAGARVWNLAEHPLAATDADHPRSFSIGPAKATLVAGWSNGDQTIGANEQPLPTAEHNNALSIVVRLEFGGHSILLTGDTVGRFRGDSPSTCAYAERIMVENAGTWVVRSDVLVGQHHGGDNASSNCFIRAVKPSFVVFSAGHKDYHHPTAAAAARFLAHHVRASNMFRTDRGDDEGDGEWIYGSIKGCIDEPGDDDVDIWLPTNTATPVKATYLRPASPICRSHTAAYER